MTTTAAPARRSTPAGSAGKRPRSGLGRWFKANALRIYGVLAFIYLFIPIAYVTAFSFNNTTRSNVVWLGFTWHNWADPCGRPGVCASVVNSLEIGLVSTVVATVLGTLIAFALARYRFRGRGLVNILIFLPMATPEVVMAASLLTLFLNASSATPLNLGMGTIIIAHIMFCISFVVVTVKARIASLDPRLEQAAMDLYANEVQTFRRVTLPLVAPGIAGAALLSFSLSFDDYIITSFVSGDVDTFPKFVYVAAGRGVPAEAYVFGSGMFYLALIIVLISQLISWRRAKA